MLIDPPSPRLDRTNPPSPTKSLPKCSMTPKPRVYWTPVEGREPRSRRGRPSMASPTYCSTDRYPLPLRPSNSPREKCSTSSTADCSTAPEFADKQSLPLDGAGRLAGDIQHNPVHLGDFVGDAGGDAFEDLVGHPCPV